MDRWFKAGDAAAWMMIGSLFCVLGIAIVFIFCIRSAARKATEFAEEVDFSEENTVGQAQESPLFVVDLPSEWVAIKSSNLKVVQEALKLSVKRHYDGESGLEDLTGLELAVLPPAYGWILVFGPGLERKTLDVDRCFRFLGQLSQELGWFIISAITRLSPTTAGLSGSMAVWYVAILGRGKLSGIKGR